MAARREADELLLIEEADAWFEYLEATRAQSDLRYKEVEPWAWARLSQRSNDPIRASSGTKADSAPVASANRRFAALDPLMFPAPYCELRAIRPQTIETAADRGARRPRPSGSARAGSPRESSAEPCN